MAISLHEVDYSLSTSGEMFAERRAWSQEARRERLPWPDGKPFKILSLDGGGIRGLFAATLLSQLEGEFGSIRSYFDLIAGTSTGGIIGIGLGLGIPAKRVCDIYEKDGKEIFPPLSSFHPWARVGKTFKRLFRPAHNDEALVGALKREFKDRQFGDSEARMVIPAFVGPDPQVAVFKTDHHPDYRRDWKTEAWQIARATSAAPTFFSGHQNGHAFFLDGGVWANNPVLCAVVEALTAYELAPSQIRVLSIGTGSVAEKLSEDRIGAGFIGWRDIINTAMFLTSDSHHGLASLLIGADSIIRVDPDKNEIPIIELDDWRAATEHLPAQAKLMRDRAREKIDPFFAQAVDARERFFSKSKT